MTTTLPCNCAHIHITPSCVTGSYSSLPPLAIATRAVAGPGWDVSINGTVIRNCKTRNEAVREIERRLTQTHPDIAAVVLHRSKP